MEKNTIILKATADLIVRAMEKMLLEALDLVDEGALDLGPKDISYINDDLDYIAVKYWGETPDGSRQQEYADDKDEPETISEFEAMELLTVRIHNSLRGEY